ncbi:BamA/TamA family outer membrane protein [Sphingobacterium sp. N143]|uniref:BamA/TamA family outer membrane protein n=1 Tax=Sphingobacterium sp. N143 TaxID=2746727 RepID=UPI0025783AB1|nr:BamA/TamA family outer membrane protein [Sphingobacterium sp. N143]MDM1296678.1 BamA/TamA family outer membrane protein [Sphingobacterium sp. N143]
MQHFLRNRYLHYFTFLWLLLTLFPNSLNAQSEEKRDTVSNDKIHPDSALASQYDISDLIGRIIHPKRKKERSSRRSPITLMPNIAYNPTIGGQIGIKAVAGKVLGDPKTTTMSIAATSASITTKNIMVFYISHNVFTPNNKLNFQGTFALVKMVALDAGLGMTPQGKWNTEEEKIVANPDHQKYGAKYNAFTFNEKVYKRVADGLFLGAGVAFDLRRKIISNGPMGNITPNSIYTEKHGFEPDSYNSNGLLFNMQYTTRDNPNRPYKGIYSDIGLRWNTTLLGSSKNAVQLSTDFRKYFSLSESDPAHVLAFWYWGSYKLGGTLPYFELPGTGRDVAVRSGRGYTLGYFKGTSFGYAETEYRFPILKNRFLSGAAFFNLQSASDELGTKLFERWQPGGGAGLRVLFNKATRTNLCLDYAFGKYGSRGFFLGLNEAF